VGIVSITDCGRKGWFLSNLVFLPACLSEVQNEQGYTTLEAITVLEGVNFRVVLFSAVFIFRLEAEQRQRRVWDVLKRFPHPSALPVRDEKTGPA